MGAEDHDDYPGEMKAWVEELCTIAAARSASSKSIKRLLESAGRTLIPRSEFMDATVDWFRMHPDDIDHWLEYSVDQRTSPSPYVRRMAAGDERLVYEVGFFDPDLGFTDVSRHSDGAQAVAEFLHREVNWALRNQRVN